MTSWTLEQKAAQMLIVGFEGLEPPDYILEWLAEGRIGGIILFARNVQSPTQLARLTRMCHEAARTPILIGIDQEGGTVARLHEKFGFTESPGAMAIASTGSSEYAEQTAAMLATEMRELGINWVYAPVVDVTHSTENATVGTRSLGTDKDEVARLAVAEVKGFQSNGVIASPKHFPGLGNTPVDTHLALAVIDEDLDFLWNQDLIPFRAAVDAGADCVMVSHVMFTQLDPDYPSTLSKKISTDLLRGEIGFTGAVCTDCMEMKAVSGHWGAGESAVLAALAGSDLIHFSHTRRMQEEVSAALTEAVQSGRLPSERVEDAFERIQKLKATYPAVNLSVEKVGSPERRAAMDAIAREAVVVLQPSSYFPLDTDAHKIGLIEFGSWLDSGAVEGGDKASLSRIMAEKLPQLQTFSMMSDDERPETMKTALALVDAVDVVVLATRNAHLLEMQLQKSKQLAEAVHAQGKVLLLLALRNPYDVLHIPHVDGALCACGDSAPSVRAIADVLTGESIPQGKLSVEMPVW